MLTAQDIMSENVVTIGSNATVQEAIDTLLEKNISGLPVVDPRGQFVGIVTEFALLAIAYDENIRQEKVFKHMSTELITVDPNAPVRKVADLCIIHRVRRIPVVQEGHLQGMISRRDVLKSVYGMSQATCLA